ncbi:MAG: glycosyltransferase [Thermodesulfobacteriota bacterium]
MKNCPDLPVQMVFTAALKEELPLNWLKSLNLKVFSLKALKAGAWKGQDKSDPDKSSLFFIVSGVGIAAAHETALWIKENLRPLFVVNLGTVGGIGSGTDIGEWVLPGLASNEQGETLPLDRRTPFPWPESINRRLGGALLSVEKPRFGDLPADWKKHQYLDMESFAYAKAFAGTGISFHAIKWVSDLSDSRGREQFQASLINFRQELQQVLAFLDKGEGQDISVIIPVFNRKGWIAASVESVLKQTLPAREVIVVDDGSDDGTIDVLAPYKDRLTILVLPENRGVAAARNAGIAEASCPWVCFLDSDDLWKADKLERQQRFLNAHPFYEILQCEEVWIRNGRRVNPCRHHEKPRGWIWEPSLTRCLVSPSAVMMRRGLIERLGGFDENLPVCEDYDLWIRISRDHVVGLDPTPSVIKHGGHEDQLSGSYPAMDSFRVKALLKALKKEKEMRYRDELIRVLRQKLTILIQGSRKRMRFEKCREYETILNSLIV